MVAKSNLLRPARLTVGIVAACLLCGPAASQDSDLAARLSADQAKAQALSQRLEMIAKNGGETRVAEMFGESDEEKAARLQKEQAQDSSIATLSQRVGDLEETLRRLTGQVEELDHRVGEFNEKLTRVRKEFEYRICALAAQQLGASATPGEENGLPCGAAQQSAAPGFVPPSAGGTHLAPPPGVLGTLPRGELSQQNQAPANQMAAIDVRSQFDAAMNLVARAQYAEARAAMQAFADTHPDDTDLTPRALYWVGDIAYSVQKDYAGAARAFLQELKTYPQNEHAPDSMLKLGQSLIAMNLPKEKKEGCRALATLPNQYPTAPKSVTDKALAERKASGCR
ncbi:MAG TPA: tetratricopeptide repeat protein [Rhizomicrobium sp.]|jgi:tol-pal system protein YbgF|nr:tetratricopeptide repeat protein [Rhizomicrobium sp.]